MQNQGLCLYDYVYMRDVNTYFIEVHMAENALLMSEWIDCLT